MSRRDWAAIRKALAGAGLTAVERDTLVEWACHNQTLQQIADRDGVSKVAVHYRVAAANRKLRAAGLPEARPIRAPARVQVMDPRNMTFLVQSGSGRWSFGRMYGRGRKRA